MIAEFAAAKVNLALHVTGQRADGYHLLDSLVVFATAGDRLTFAPAPRDGFSLSGRFAAHLSQEAGGNLVEKARDLLRRVAERQGLAAPQVHIHLEKNLPVASGIGGGSADAAAALRGLNRFWGLDIPLADLAAMGLALGADVPMCVESRPLVARGIGEDLRLLSDFPAFLMLLVNPLVEVSTPAIFKALHDKNNPPLALPADREPASAWIAALAGARNDLQPPAEVLAPVIGEVLAALADTAPLLARMSGSGATCFALYESDADLAAARARLEAARPGWYVEATRTLGEA